MSAATVDFLELPNGERPAETFLDRIDERISDRLTKLIEHLAQTHRTARPSGSWKPMRDALAGVWEVRCVGPGRTHYRLFVLIDRVAQGSEDRPHFVLLDGAKKANGSLLPSSFYRQLEELTTAYWISLSQK